jgi:hypothetical protein
MAAELGWAGNAIEQEGQETGECCYLSGMWQGGRNELPCGGLVPSGKVAEI